MNYQILGTALQKCLCFVMYHRLTRSLLIMACFVAYCEIIHYFVIIVQCTWPSLSPILPIVSGNDGDLKVMFLADTHLLGFREGHWLDKLRREWQMKQAFQTSMLIHKPDVVFVLGDLFDEGKWCDDKEFYYHVSRFRTMFAVPAGTQLHVLSGNHDEGFHYMMTKHKHERFEQSFDSPSVRLLNIEGNAFVLVNSMAMEGDGCRICQEAEQKLHEISKYFTRQQKCETTNEDESCKDVAGLFYTQPILLQHFPMYRRSDAECNTADAAPLETKNDPFRLKFDCLDPRSSNLLFSLIEPRLVVSAHTHHGCYRLHPNKVPEWSVSSFSWRNRNNPTFLLARINHFNHTISQCFLPEESTIIRLYVIGIIVIFISLVWPSISRSSRHKRS